jgi:hypothetical protein
MRTLYLLFGICTFLSTHQLQAQYILTLNFSEMDPYIGLQSEVRVTDIATGKEVGRKIIRPIESAAYSFDLYVLVNGGSYQVDIYADVNDNWTYDAPPTDHAWRRTIPTVSADVELNFMPDDNYTDVEIGPVFPYVNYNAIWGGHWRNLTFGSTDTIQASIDVTCDSIFGNITTQGVFGNPDTVRFDLAEALTGDFDPATDTISFDVPPPWTGSVMLFNGEVNGDISLTGTRLQFIGTAGESQIHCLYTVFFGGNPFANGYFIVREINVLSSAPPIVVEGTTTDVHCAGGSDGVIAVQVSGGSPGYLFNWSNGDTTSTVANLSAGDFTVTVTDSLGCSEEAMFTLSEPSALVLQITSTDASCIGTCDGSIQISVTGGTPPYAFVWNTGSTEMQLPDMCAGDFIVTVTDGVGCTAMASAIILEPDALVVESIQIFDATDGQANGVIVVTASGGTPPWTYSINGIAFQASNTFTGLAPGTYCVFIRDANGCILKSEEFEILNLLGLDALSNSFSLYPNPASAHLLVNAESPLTIEILDLAGNVIYTSQRAAVHRIELSNVTPGLYLVRISDETAHVYRKLIVLD